MLKPKLFTTIKSYNKEQLISDLTAGIIVGIVALPLSIALAIASGVSPEKGLFTAIIAGFLISFFGGSRVQIGGPTGAFVVIVYGIVQQYGVDGLTVATIMAGIILMIMGVIGFGSMIKFIPHPVVVGFTSGIALIIFSSQIKDFFGLQMGAVPSDFVEKWIAYGESFLSFNIYSLAIGAGSVVIIIFWQKFIKKIPGSLVALVLSAVLVQYFHLPVETIQSRFGDIPSMLPAPSFPHISFATLKHLVQPATTIALLAAIEALLSAVVSDGMIGSKHRSNMELVAEGFANVVTPFFGGIPATGAIARTATNVRNGGRTPIAGMMHAVTLLLIMVFFGSWAKLLPLASLAAILIIVAYNMSEWRSFISLLKSPRSDVVVLLTTFLLTVVVDLTVAIEIGMVLAVILFMKRMADVTNVGMVTREMNDADESEDLNAVSKKTIPHDVEVYEINGPFFFGAVEKFKEAMNLVEKSPKVRIIRMRYVNAIDATGLHTLRDVLHSSKKEHCALLISEIHAQPVFALTQAGLFQEIGEDNILGTLDEALTRSKELLGLNPAAM